MGLFNKSKDRIGLFPYTSEPIHGLTPQSSQFYGWEISKFEIPDFWKKTEGQNIKVAVLDTGCDLNHEDLVSNIIEGKNIVNPKQLPEDKNGHGTHVAGTIAAKNNGLGMVGVAPLCKIMPVKVLSDEGNGNAKNIADGIRWAADNKADIITMSLGSVLDNKPIKNAIDYAEKKGSICFCAAGNSGPNTDILYPAKYPNVVSIGAIDKFFNRTDFSCAGDSLDFLAPGEDIISCIPGNRYASMSGTSMSNPFAVGCAALLCSWNKQHKKYRLENAQSYIDIFKTVSMPLRDARYKNIRKYEGYGIINLRGVL
jgi:subtilisin family serine protease